MISRILRVLRISLKNPRYLWYFWLNVDIVHDHFPLLHKMMRKSKHLCLGGKTDISKLHVILRTTDAVMNINSSRQLDDIGIRSKNDVIRIGGCSLFPAAANFISRYGRENLHITVVGDRLSEAGLAQYREAARKASVEFDFVVAKGHGNGPTFQSQIDVALEDGDDTLAFILEDDYLLNETALVKCFEVMRNHSDVIGMNPHFHPDRVRFQDIGKLTAVDSELYCRVSSTCCTFFMPVRQMRRFERNLRLYDGWEKGSVGCAWKRGICLSPLGWTMAEHLHRCDLSPVHKLMNSEK